MGWQIPPPTPSLKEGNFSGLAPCDPKIITIVLNSSLYEINQAN